MDFHVVQRYCATHGLTFLLHADLAALFGGEEEWEDVQSAGVDVMGTPYIIQLADGTVKVVIAFTNAYFPAEDTWQTVTEDELKSGAQLHTR